MSERGWSADVRRSGPFRAWLGSALLTEAVFQATVLMFSVAVHARSASVPLVMSVPVAVLVTAFLGERLATGVPGPPRRRARWAAVIAAAATAAPAIFPLSAVGLLCCVALLGAADGVRRAARDTLLLEPTAAGPVVSAEAMAVRAGPVAMLAGLAGGGFLLASTADTHAGVFVLSAGYLLTVVVSWRGAPRVAGETDQRAAPGRWSGVRPSVLLVAACASAMPLVMTAVIVAYGLDRAVTVAWLGLLLSAVVAGRVLGGRWLNMPGAGVAMVVLASAALVLWLTRPGAGASAVLLVLSTAGTQGLVSRLRRQILTMAWGDVAAAVRRLDALVVATSAVAVVGLGLVALLADPATAVTTAGVAVLVVAGLALVVLSATGSAWSAVPVLAPERPDVAGPVRERPDAGRAVQVSIYLSDERTADAVEREVDRLLGAIGVTVVERDPPVIGSWFRRLRARAGDAAASPLGREAAQMAAHVLDSRLVLAGDAAVTATLTQSLGPLIAALQPTKDAVVRVGALLIVKIEWQLAVHQLTAVQQLRLDHHPGLLTSPQDILAALDITRTTPAVEPPGAGESRRLIDPREA